MDLYVKIAGVKGPVTSPASRAGMCRVRSFDWDGADAPTSGGTSIGRTRLKPLVMTKGADAGSVPILNALFTNSQIGADRSVSVIADSPSSTTGPSNNATITMTPARVQKIVITAVDGGADDILEEVTLVFSQVTLRQDPSGATMTSPAL